MHEAVSDVLVERAREAEGLSRMILYSLLAHAAILTIVALVPAEWRGRSREPESTPMMISLGGAPGPDAGGMTQISGRAVQAVAPPEPKQPFTTAPAPKKPEMVAPEPEAKPAPRISKPVEKPAERSSSRKPTTGAEIKSGAARVDTGGAPIPFGGLTTGGGGTGGVQINVGDFCCPEYVVTMNQLIRKNWNESQGAAGLVTVKFVIRRDGMLTNVEVAKSSGNPILDLESRRAVLNTQRLPPLPPQFTPPTLTVHLIFEYKR